MRLPALLLALGVAALVGCNSLPGRPAPGPEVPRPQQILDFTTLYRQNCAGCHGVNGEKGPATPLNNPEYQALIDDATLRDVIANGQKGTMMPGFALGAGGMLSDDQVSVLLKGIRSKWFKGDVLQGANAPAYKSSQPGDVTRGLQVYRDHCARCHGVPGGPPGPKGSILDGSFLALVSEQMIRTTAIVGRPDLGMPDWRTRLNGRPMTDQEVSDVVAWIMTQKPSTPGQPYNSAHPTSMPPAKEGQ